MKITERRLRRVIRQVILESVGSGESISLSGVRIDNFSVSFEDNAELYVDGVINIKSTMSMYGENDPRKNFSFEYESLTGDYDGIAEKIVKKIVELELFVNGKTDSELEEITKYLGNLIREKMF